jgi:hypothetical protein
MAKGAADPVCAMSHALPGPHTRRSLFAARRGDIVGHPYEIAEISHAAENGESHNHGSEDTDSDRRPSLGSPRPGDVTIGDQS